MGIGLKPRPFYGGTEFEVCASNCEAAGLTHAAVFMKDSLLPIMGEENMRRELPWSERFPEG